MRSECANRTKGTEPGARGKSLTGDPAKFLWAGFLAINFFLDIVTAATASCHAFVLFRTCIARAVIARKMILRTVMVHRWQQPAAYQVGHESDAGNPRIHENNALVNGKAGFLGTTLQISDCSTIDEIADQKKA